MKNLYVHPEVKVELLLESDVITTSDNIYIPIGSIDDPDQPADFSEKNNG